MLFFYAVWSEPERLEPCFSGRPVRDPEQAQKRPFVAKPFLEENSVENGKKKVVVFQAEPESLDLSYAQIVERWKKGLREIPQVGEIRLVNVTGGQPNLERYHREIGDADAAMGIWIHKGVINEELFSRHPNLKYIATLGHGFEDFDAVMTRRYGVTIANTVYGDVTIAQYAMALLLNICHNVTLQSDYAKCGYWEEKEKNPAAADYRKLMVPQIELFGKTMGIIGLGAIGLWTARMAAGFGMKVIANSRHKKTGPEYDFVEQVGLDELLERSDVISVHCPHTKETENLLDRSAFARMKDGVILINTARGLIIDEEALLEALNSRKVYMAGLDVIAKEPPANRISLMKSPYTFITSHIAWLPKAARLRAVDLALQNYRSYLEGRPRSVING